MAPSRAMVDDGKARLDGYLNLLSGLGQVERDLVGAHQFRREALLQDQQCEDLYHYSDLAATIVDAIVEDALREQVSVLVDDDPEASSAATEEQRRLGVQDVVRDADVWARCVGDAAILLGADDGRSPEAPLDLASVQTLDYLDVVHRYELSVVRRFGDVGASDEPARAGQVEVYRMTRDSSTTYVHESRLVVLVGARTSRRERVANNGWHHSVLQRVHRVLQQVNLTWDSIGQIVAHASQAILKMRELFSAVAGGQKQVVTDRLNLLYLGLGLGIMPIDTEESFEYSERTFAGLPEMSDRNWQRLAAAARMPLTRLMGISPAGLNATGESDAANWRAQVRAHQAELRAPLERVQEVIFAARQGPFKGQEPEHWEIVFPSLVQMSSQEEAAYRSTVATADETNVRAGLYTAEEAARSHYRPEGYTHEVQIDWGARAAADASKQSTIALNGAQVAAMVDIVARVSAGELPRESGVAIIVASFPIDTARAEAIVGQAGTPSFGAVREKEEGRATQQAQASAAARERDERATEDASVAQALLARREARRATK